MNFSTKADYHSHVRWMSNIAIVTFCALSFFVDFCVSPVTDYPGISSYDLFGPEDTNLTPNLNLEATISSFKASPGNVVILDYDGTLTKFNGDANAAIPSDGLIEALHRLNEDRKSLVAIISGRDQAFLHKHFGKYQNFLISAEHGAFVRPPGATEWVDASQIPGLRSSWQEDVKQKIEKVRDEYDNSLLQSNPDIMQRTSIETKKTGVVFHYRSLHESEDADKTTSQEISRRIVAEFKGYKVDHVEFLAEHDALAIDIRPKQFTKAAMAVSAWDLQPDARMIICLGDGSTDEAMFKSLQQHSDTKPPGSFTLTTAHVDNEQKKPTAAEFIIKDVDTVNNLLRAFYGLQAIETKSIKE